MESETARDWCKDLLARLDRAFRWAVAFTAAFFLVAVDGNAPVKLLDVDVQRGTAGVILFVLLIGSFIEIGRGLTTLLFIVAQEGPAADIAKNYVRLDFAIGNAFAETQPRGNVLLDSIGVLLDVVIWYIGAIAGRALLVRSNISDAITVWLFVVYAIVGLWIAGLAVRLIERVSSTTRLRNARYVAGGLAIVGGATLGYLTFGV